jgi:hypothetical protein
MQKTYVLWSDGQTVNQGDTVRSVEPIRRTQPVRANREHLVRVAV